MRSAAPSTAPVGVGGVGDRSRFGSMASATGRRGPANWCAGRWVLADAGARGGGSGGRWRAGRWVLAHAGARGGGGLAHGPFDKTVLTWLLGLGQGDSVGDFLAVGGEAGLAQDRAGGFDAALDQA